LFLAENTKKSRVTTVTISIYPDEELFFIAGEDKLAYTVDLK